MKPYGGPASCDHVYHILTLSGTDLLRLHRIRFFFFFILFYKHFSLTFCCCWRTCKASVLEGL